MKYCERTKKFNGILEMYLLVTHWLQVKQIPEFLPWQIKMLQVAKDYRETSIHDKFFSIRNTKYME